jgi:lysophospholipase L1-like esterase
VPTVTVDRATLTAEVFGVDGFHPGPVGHDRLAAAVLPFVPAG